VNFALIGKLRTPVLYNMLRLCVSVTVITLRYQAIELQHACNLLDKAGNGHAERQQNTARFVVYTTRVTDYVVRF